MDLTTILENMRKGDEARKASLPLIDSVDIKTYPYKENKQAFNIYKIKGSNEKNPLIVYVHGGAWIYGDIFLEDHFCSYLASKNFDVLSLSYPLLFSSPGVNLKVMINYLVELFNYTFVNCENLALDFHNVMLIGDSAGAHLVSLMYAVLSSDKFKEMYGVKSSFNTNNIKQIVLNHPVTDVNDFIEENSEQEKTIKHIFLSTLLKGENEEFCKNANLTYYLKDIQFPPTIVVSSEGDNLSRIAFNLIKELNLNKREQEFIYVDDVKYGHVFNIGYYNLEKSMEVNNKILDSFKNKIIM